MTTEQRVEALENDLDNVKQTLIQVADILHNTADRQRENSAAIDRLGQRLDRFEAIAEEREQQTWSVLNVLIEDNTTYRSEIRALREENRKILEYLLGRDANGDR